MRVDLALLALTSFILPVFSASIANEVDWKSSHLVSSDDVQAASEPKLEKRAVGNLYVCQNTQFTQTNGGLCRNIQFETQVCNNFPSPYVATIQSLGPDAGFECEFYEGPSCSGVGLYGVRRPGLSDLGAFNFNRVAKSFLCRLIM